MTYGGSYAHIPISQSKFLVWAEYAENSLHHSVTGLSPVQCILDLQPPMYPWYLSHTEVLVVDDWLGQAEWETTYVQIGKMIK